MAGGGTVRGLKWSGIAVIVALATCAPTADAALVSPTTSPEDPSPYVDWPALLPPLPSPAKDPSERECIDGADSCIDRTIEEMKQRFDTVIPVCDHRAVFSLAYLRVTEEVRASIHRGLFSDPKWLQNEDRVFARMYFNAYDDYEAGRLDRIPVAWRLAFRSAKRREIGALGDFLMAMNAHINRDMPYMVEGVGIRKPDGTSRKPDHDVFNQRLAALYQPVLREVAQRFDPTADNIDAGPIDNEMAFGLLQSWREGVWRNAERLTNARTPAQRRQVAASIESFAATSGRTILTLLRYRAGQSSQARDAWCAVHGGQEPS